MKEISNKPTQLSLCEIKRLDYPVISAFKPPLFFYLCPANADK
jgi:hypothetical protein